MLLIGMWRALDVPSLLGPLEGVAMGKAGPEVASAMAFLKSKSRPENPGVSAFAMLLAMTRCRSARSTNPFDWKSKALVSFENIDTSTVDRRVPASGPAGDVGQLWEKL